MKPVYKLLAMTVASMTAVGATAAPGNNPASVQYVQEYVNNAISNNPGPRGFTGSTGATGAVGAAGAKGATGATGSVNTYAIGDAAFGGIVAYVDPTGQHGLVVACSDVLLTQGSGSTNSTIANTTTAATCSGTTVSNGCFSFMPSGTTDNPTNAVATGLGAGLLNSALIGARSASTNSSVYPASVAASLASYQITTTPGEICSVAANSSLSSAKSCASYYLPSVGEWQLIASAVLTINDGIEAYCPSDNKLEISMTNSAPETAGFYWTSNEVNYNTGSSGTSNSNAYSFSPYNTDGNNGFAVITDKTTALRVRPVRAF